MVIEQVDIEVELDNAQAFVAAMLEARKLLAAAEGAQEVSLIRGIETPTRFVLRIHWGSIDDHVSFTKTEQFVQFRERVGHFFSKRPVMEHFASV
jgi:heme-degrading monooxygenase HmoA